MFNHLHLDFRQMEFMLMLFLTILLAGLLAILFLLLLPQPVIA